MIKAPRWQRETVICQMFSGPGGRAAGKNYEFSHGKSRKSRKKLTRRFCDNPKMLPKSELGIPQFLTPYRNVPIDPAIQI